jgi:hypothetical protein
MSKKDLLGVGAEEESTGLCSTNKTP